MHKSGLKGIPLRHPIKEYLTGIKLTHKSNFRVNASLWHKVVAAELREYIKLNYTPNYPDSNAKKLKQLLLKKDDKGRVKLEKQEADDSNEDDGDNEDDDDEEDDEEDGETTSGEDSDDEDEDDDEVESISDPDEDNNDDRDNRDDADGGGGYKESRN